MAYILSQQEEHFLSLSLSLSPSLSLPDEDRPNQISSFLLYDFLIWFYHGEVALNSQLVRVVK